MDDPQSLHPEIKFVLDHAATQIAGPCGMLLSLANVPDISSLSKPELACRLNADLSPVAAALKQLHAEGVYLPEHIHRHLTRVWNWDGTGVGRAGARLIQHWSAQIDNGREPTSLSKPAVPSVPFKPSKPLDSTGSMPFEPAVPLSPATPVRPPPNDF